MAIELRAAIMQRPKLRQKFLKERTNDSKHLCNKQKAFGKNEKGLF